MAETREAVDAAGFQEPAVFYGSNEFTCCTTTAMIRQYFLLSAWWWDKIYGSKEAKSKNWYTGYGVCSISVLISIVKISPVHDRNFKLSWNRIDWVQAPVQERYECVQLKEEEELTSRWILQACQDVSRQENKSELDGRPWRICPSSSSSYSCQCDWDQSRRTWLHDLLTWPIMSVPDEVLVYQLWWKVSVL